MEIIYLLLVLIIAFFAWIIVGGRREDEKRELEAAEYKRLYYLEADRKKRLLDEATSLFTGWSHITPAQINGSSGVFALSENGLLVRYLTYDDTKADFEKRKDRTFAARSVLSLDVVIPDVTKTRTNYERVAEPVQKNRSVVGRAAVGGVVLGPLGAVVGGMTGLQPNTKIVERTVKKTETYQTKGPSVLVIGLRDVSEPVLRVMFDPSKLSNEWWYRLNAARQS